jgi:hypothetical protein
MDDEGAKNYKCLLERRINLVHKWYKWIIRTSNLHTIVYYTAFIILMGPPTVHWILQDIFLKFKINFASEDSRKCEVSGNEEVGLFQHRLRYEMHPLRSATLQNAVEDVGKDLENCDSIDNGCLQARSPSVVRRVVNTCQ